MRLPLPLPLDHRVRRNVALVSLLDVSSGALAMIGLQLVGSGVYVVVFASCTIWTAVFSVWLLNRPLVRLQWAGVALVAAGLLTNAFANAAAVETEANAAKLFWGTIIALAGAIGHSLMYVANDKLLRPTPAAPKEGSADAASSKKSDGTATAGVAGDTELRGGVEAGISSDSNDSAAEGDEADREAAQLISRGSASKMRATDTDESTVLEPSALCSAMGMLETAYNLVWLSFILVFTPFGTELANAMTVQGTSLLGALPAWSLLVVANGGHAWAFFQMLGSIGAVSSGMLKALQTVTVFTFSAVFFCSYEASQCFTPMRAVSVTLVLVGITTFSFGSQQAAAAGATDAAAAAKSRQRQ